MSQGPGIADTTSLRRAVRIFGIVLMTIGMLVLMGIGTVFALGYFIVTFIAPPNPDVADPPTLWSSVKAVWLWLLLSGAAAGTGALLYWLGTTTLERR